MPEAPINAPHRVSAGISITTIGAVVTILLTVWNAVTKYQVDATAKEIEDRRTRVEESKERVERYKFVLSTLNGIATRDSTDRLVALAIARLALEDREASDLFERLSVSQDASLRALGRQGADQEQATSRRDPTVARRLERAGYEALIRGELRAAADSFARAEAAYPTFHQAYELSRYLGRQPATLAPDRLSTVLGYVLDSLSRYATAEEKQLLRAGSQR